MRLTRFFAVGATACALLGNPLLAGEIMVDDAYMRSSTPSSTTGAAFMVLMNHGDADDRLIGVATEIAGRAELHTHKQDANGVMRMMEVEEGFTVPAGGMHALRRGGDHIMLMQLARPLEDGEEIVVTLTFEKAGDVEVVVPVDRARRPDHGATGHDH